MSWGGHRFILHMGKQEQRDYILLSVEVSVRGIEGGYLRQWNTVLGKVVDPFGIDSSSLGGDK